VANWDSKVIECLQDYRDELRDPRCRQQVHQAHQEQPRTSSLIAPWLSPAKVGAVPERFLRVPVSPMHPFQSARSPVRCLHSSRALLTLSWCFFLGCS